MRKISLYLLLLLNFEALYSQTIEITGKVIDSVTSLPIPYASVGLRKLGVGTITNRDGRFRLLIPESTKTQNLSISFMGYKTYLQEIEDIQTPFICHLQPDTLLLREVVIQPDTLYRLLAKAYRAIPQNYPDKPVSYIGFYREAQRANDTLYLNFIEAILEVYKNTYSDNHNYGQIRIVKSRKNTFPGLDTINNVRFYGGPFFPHSYDFVFSRSSFINPKYYRRYQYKLLDIKKNDDDDIYIIGFNRCDDTIQNGFSGKLYIDKKTLAYVGAEIKESGEVRNRQKSIFNSPYYKRGEAEIKIGYIKQNEKWHIGYVTKIAEGENTLLKKKDYHETEYITTEMHTDSVSPIPYEQQFGYHDIISIKAQDYLSGFWKDYNILEGKNELNRQLESLYRNGEAEKILARKYPQKKNKRDEVFKIITRFSFDLGIGYLPFSSQGGLYQISCKNSKGNTLTQSKDIDSNSFSMVIYSGMSYALNKHFAIYFSSNEALMPNQSFNTWNLGIRYRNLLTHKGRPWFMDIGVAYSHADNMVKLGKTNNLDDGIDISGKNLNADKIKAFIGKRYDGIKPELSISRKAGKFAEIFLSGSYFYTLGTKDIVQFKEASGFFLTRKKVILPVDDSHIQLTIDGVQKKESNISVKPYQIVFGVRIGF